MSQTALPEGFVENGDVIIYRGSDLLAFDAAREALEKAGVKATLWWVRPEGRLVVSGDSTLRAILARYGVPGSCGHARHASGECAECRHRNQWPRE